MIIIYLALQDVDLAIADVQMIAHLVHFGRKSVALLRGLQSDLSLFLDDPVLLFMPLPQFLNLFTSQN
jgi:hypothetical protein